MRARAVTWIWLALASAGCPSGGGAPQPGQPQAARPDAAPALHDAAGGEGHDEGQLGARRMKIWGEVRVILKRKHAPLPPLEQQATQSKSEPHATIVNATPYALTVWLAGPCLNKLELRPQSERSVEFCAGVYVVAAKVSTEAFLPLVREQQRFELGIRYTLRIQIQRPPTTTRTKRWVQEPKP